MKQLTPEKLVDSAEMAIESEIEAVRERPSHDVLTGGKKIKSPAEGEVHYRFETGNPSLRFAESCQATLSGKTITVVPVETGEEHMVFRFPDDYGDQIAEVEMEWENDFVLKRIRDALMNILDHSDRRDRINRMLHPEDAKTEAHDDIRDDGMRNTAQREAIAIAMHQPVSFIWGPPGTGKTATLAYIMANYALHRKKVLFVSNTNRAVDHGMLGVLQAMETLGIKAIPKRITRFGERVLESNRLDDIHFEQQLEKEMSSQMQEAADLQHWLDARNLPDLTDEQRKHIEQKIERMGGEEAVEDQIRELTQKESRAYSRLRQFQVTGTTLARVCTSDMLESMEFDAVVIDEASMANLPYMLVMASKAKEHLVIVGDPMQLPPIAITNDQESRSVLEQDIFAAVSGAASAGDLFRWHDAHPEFTSFFDIQYRMQSDLARVISEVFYEGRLRSAGDIEAEDHQYGPEKHQSGSGKPHHGSDELQPRSDKRHSRSTDWHIEFEDDRGTRAGSARQGGKDMTQDVQLVSDSAASVALIDSSSLRPSLRQDKNRKGFQPVNDIHATLLNDVVRRILVENRARLHEIGIIVPFRSTVWQLRKELRGKNRWYDLEIGTIHTFQGREKKIIILDTVMSGEPRGRSVHHYSVRPFDEAKNGLSVPRLLNVAFSRSREKLVVLADMQHIKRVYGQKFLGKLLGRLPVQEVSSF